GADRVVALLDLLPRQTDDVAVEEDVLATAEFGAEPRAEFQHRGDAAVRLDKARRGLERSADDLQQRRLAGAVASNDPDGLAARYLEAHVIERREFVIELAPRSDQELLQAIARLLEQPKAFSDAYGADGGIR